MTTVTGIECLEGAIFMTVVAFGVWLCVQDSKHADSYGDGLVCAAIFGVVVDFGS